MKKVLSVLMAVLMAFSSLSAGFCAFAAEAQQAAVTVSVYDAGFVRQPSALTVSADLSDKYESSVGCNDEGDAPTILDALIATSIDLYGEEFTETKPLKVSAEYGWKMITAACGKDYPALTYYRNGAMANGLDDALAAGDVLELDFFQQEDYSDQYVFFDTFCTTVAAGDTLTLTASAQSYDSNYQIVTSPAAGLTVSVDGKTAGTTDSKGKVKVKIRGTGAHLITAASKQQCIFAPWCMVTASELTTYVRKEMRAAAKYLTKEKDAFTCDEAVDFLMLLKSGYSVKKYKAAFLDSVKQNLKENGGKLVSAYTGAEDIGLYGAVIGCLRLLGYNPTKFDGCNLVKAFESVDLKTAVSNPYYYRVAIEAADEAFGKTLCDDMISRYTMGKGMEHWGYSCDNTAHFLTALAKYKDSYPEIVADAKKVIASYTKKNGAYADNTYVTTVNPDSTALAMMAFSAVGDAKTAFKYYRWLVQGWEGKTGVFRYDGVENAYATKDALLALAYFKTAANEQKLGHTKHVVKTKLTRATLTKNGKTEKICAVCGKVIGKTVIYRPKKTIKIAQKTYRYTGKAITPKVTVYSRRGKKIASKYYTVTYKHNKKVGTATIVVTFNGKYKGKLTKTFKIVKK